MGKYFDANGIMREVDFAVGHDPNAVDAALPQAEPVVADNADVAQQPSEDVVIAVVDGEAPPTADGN